MELLPSPLEQRFLAFAVPGYAEDLAWTVAMALFLDADSIPKYLRWNLNMIALDNADVAKMAAQVWLWAENEPSVTDAGAYVLVDTNGRWVASTKAPRTSRACWDGATLVWSIVPFKKDCPAGTAFTPPTDPWEARRELR